MTTSPRRLFDERCNAEDENDDHDGSGDDHAYATSILVAQAHM